VAALGAGGVLEMLSNSLSRFAYDRWWSLAGAARVVGFCASLFGS
jgi:hypothetical protein